MVSEDLKKALPIALGAAAAGAVIFGLIKGKEEKREEKIMGFEIDVKIE